MSHPNAHGHDDWSKKLNDLHGFVSSKSDILRRSLEPGKLLAITDFIERVPVLMKGIEDLEAHQAKQQTRLDSRQKLLNKYKTYKDKQVTDATTKSQRLRRENEFLRRSMRESAVEADIAKMNLAAAKNRLSLLDSAWEDNMGLIGKNNDLQEMVDACTASHSDIDVVRQEVINLQRQTDLLRPAKIEEEYAKRLSNTMISEIDRLKDRVKAADARAAVLEEERSQSQEVRTKLENELEDVQHLVQETEFEVENLTDQLARCKCAELRARQASPEIPPDRRLTSSPVPMNIGVTRKTPTTTAPPPFAIPLQQLSTLIPDMLPKEFIESLRSRLVVWQASPMRNWDKPQPSNYQIRTCIEVRLEKRKSDWVHGTEYACGKCEKGKRLCVVMNSKDVLWVLPRKEGAKEGKSLSDLSYWMND